MCQEGQLEFLDAVVSDLVMMHTDDRTDRVQAAQRRRAADERYRTLVEELPVAAYTGLPGSDTPMAYVSPEIESMLGYSRDRWITDPTLYDSILHPEDRDRVIAAYRRSVRAGTRFRSEHRMVAADGRIVWIRDEAVAVPQADGKTTAEHGVLVDITERKLAEEARVQAEHDLRFQAGLLDAVGQAVIATTADGIITYWNRFAETLYGWRADEVIGRNVATVTPSEMTGAQAEDIMRCLGAGETWTGEFLVRRHDGTTFPASVTDTPIRDAVGRLTGIIGVSSDITERKRVEEVLLRSEQRYRSLVESSPDGIALLDEHGYLLMANAGLVHMLGYDSADAVVGRAFMEHLPEDEHSRAADAWQRRAQRVGVSPQAVSYQVARRDGSSFPAEIRTAAVQGAEGESLMTTVMVRDVTERASYEAQLQHFALHDTVTGLPNHTLLQDRLQQNLSVAQRTGESLALLVLDLDQFKAINDTYGHASGDQTLQEVGRRFSGELRASDTLARLGGDQFAVILPKADLLGAMQAATKLTHALERPIDLACGRVHVGVNVGMALFPDHAEEGERLLRFADIALQAAKEANSGYAVYAVDRDPYSPTRLALSDELREAIETDALVLHYQPKLHLAGGGIEGMEALVRWNHPVHGLIPPDQFIPLAEHSGLIRPLTMWVIEQALSQCAEWRAMGFDVGIAVNLSARSLHDSELTQFIIQCLRTNGVPPSQFTVEITESVIMANPERAMERLMNLTEIGVKLSIDDFGTGYSSLAYLRHLRAHQVKIDRSFVMDLDTNEENGFIVRSVIELGHNLGFDVVAEGIENQATQDILTALRCDLAQGYYVSRPSSAAETTAWLRRRESTVHLDRAALRS